MKYLEEQFCDQYDSGDHNVCRQSQNELFHDQNKKAIKILVVTSRMGIFCHWNDDDDHYVIRFDDHSCITKDLFQTVTAVKNADHHSSHHPYHL